MRRIVSTSRGGPTNSHRRFLKKGGGLQHLSLPVSWSLPHAIAIDLDGTLLDGRSQISERNRKALKSCLDRNIPVIIATSPALRTVRKLLPSELYGACSLVTLNGAVGYGAPPLEGFLREELPEAIAMEIIEIVLRREPDARLVVELDGEHFGTNVFLEPTALWKTNAATPDMVLPITEALGLRPTKVAVNGLGRNLSNLIVELRERFNSAVSFLPTYDMTFLNIVSLQASKSRTLGKLLSSKGLDSERVVAFGDDLPDIDLLTACGFSFSMANAAPEVHAAAKYRTGSNDEDGVSIVLEEMLRSI